MSSTPERISFTLEKVSMGLVGFSTIYSSPINDQTSYISISKPPWTFIACSCLNIEWFKFFFWQFWQLKKNNLINMAIYALLSHKLTLCLCKIIVFFYVWWQVTCDTNTWKWYLLLFLDFGISAHICTRRNIQCLLCKICNSLIWIFWMNTKKTIKHYSFCTNYVPNLRKVTSEIVIDKKCNYA